MLYLGMIPLFLELLILFLNDLDWQSSIVQWVGSQIANLLFKIAEDCRGLEHFGIEVHNRPETHSNVQRIRGGSQQVELSNVESDEQ